MILLPKEMILALTLIFALFNIMIIRTICKIRKENIKRGRYKDYQNGRPYRKCKW